MKKPIYSTRPILVLILLVKLSFGYSQNKPAIHDLPISTPEAEGVSSAGILKFIDALDQGGNEIHSFVIVRHGKIISEGWWNPYGRELKHVMFSVSKSFTSVGVGLAVAENKLKVTDKVISFFPGSLPDTLSDYMRGMTVQDLLKMSTGMNSDPLFQAMNGSLDWPKTFFSTPVENKPGTLFKYNNMATFMLSAIVQKATGEKLFDYLQPRLFEPLGIRNVTWDERPAGFTLGAIGLRLGSADMAKFGQLLLQKGKWNGKQLIPEPWIDEATSPKIESNDPGNKNPKASNDWAQGYGYQFWMSRNNSYRADGLGGQFILVLPEKDAVIVLTASSLNTQEELNVVWDHLLPAIPDKPLTADKEISQELTKRIGSLSLSKTTSLPPHSISVVAKISGKRIEVAQNELGVQAVSITMQDTGARVEFVRNGEKYEMTAGLDKWRLSETVLNTLNAAPRPNPTATKVASKCSWINPTTFELSARFIEESIGSEVWHFQFEEAGNGIKVDIDTRPVPTGMPFGRPPIVLNGRIAN